MLTEAEVQAHADRIRDDGYTVIEQAASADLFLWVIDSTRPTPSLPPVSVNISGRSFDDPTLPGYIAELLVSHGVRPELGECAAHHQRVGVVSPGGSGLHHPHLEVVERTDGDPAVHGDVERRSEQQVLGVARGRARGDMHVQFTIEIPKQLNDRQANLFIGMSQILNE